MVRFASMSATPHASIGTVRWHSFRRGHRVGLVVYAIAFIARMTWALLVDAKPVGDATWYHTTAEMIASGSGYVVEGRPTAYWPVGYSAVLGGLYALVGASPLAGRALNAVFSFGALCFTSKLATRIHSPRVGLATAALLALYPADSRVLLGTPLGAALLLLDDGRLLRRGARDAPERRRRGCALRSRGADPQSGRSASISRLVRGAARHSTRVETPPQAICCDSQLSRPRGRALDDQKLGRAGPIRPGLHQRWHQFLHRKQSSSEWPVSIRLDRPRHSERRAIAVAGWNDRGRRGSARVRPRTTVHLGKPNGGRCTVARKARGALR